MNPWAASSLYDLLYIYPRAFAQANVVVSNPDGGAGEVCTVDEDDLADLSCVEPYCIAQVCVDNIVKECQYHLRIIFLEALVLKHRDRNKRTKGPTLVAGAGHGVIDICNGHGLGIFVDLRTFKLKRISCSVASLMVHQRRILDMSTDGQ